jgi:hypothetical protein
MLPIDSNFNHPWAPPLFIISAGRQCAVAMGKRKASAAVGDAAGGAAAADGPSDTSAAVVADIDDIFGAIGAKAAAKKELARRQLDDDAAAPDGGAKGKRPKREKGAVREARSEFVPPDRAERSGWIDDGLGGVHDKEGWTGRKTEDGMRIFKTRLLQPTKRKQSGGTPDCPFDCDCCYI